MLKKIIGETPIIDTLYESDFYTEFHKHSIEQRCKDSRRVLNKYPEKIPCLFFKGTKETPDSKNHKFLLPKEMTISEFMMVARKYIKLDPSQAIFLFVDNVLPRSTETIGETYLKHKSEDGYLKFTYSIESTFG